MSLDNLTISNSYYRRVLQTDDNMQLVLMNLLPKQDIGMEIHKNTTQFIKVENGQGQVILGKDEMKLTMKIKQGESIMIPAGTYHNIINTSTKNPLQLYTIYSPPNHPAGLVQETKPIND